MHRTRSTIRSFGKPAQCIEPRRTHSEHAEHAARERVHQVEDGAYSRGDAKIVRAERAREEECMERSCARSRHEVEGGAPMTACAEECRGANRGQLRVSSSFWRATLTIGGPNIFPSACIPSRRASLAGGRETGPASANVCPGSVRRSSFVLAVKEKGAGCAAGATNCSVKECSREGDWVTGAGSRARAYSGACAVA